MKAKLTLPVIAAMAPGETIWDTDTRGLGVRCRQGATSYVYKGRVAGKQVFVTIGRHGALTLAQAKTEATKFAGDVAARRDPAAEKRAERAATKAAKVEAQRAAQSTFGAVVDLWLTRVARPKHRTAAASERLLERLVLPAWRDRDIRSIRRVDVSNLIDGIAAETPVQGARVLRIISAIFGWQAIRDEDFVSPIVRGMAPMQPSEIARDRVLTDDEIRAVWRATLDPAATVPVFGSFVRFLLLTACRRGEALGLTWSEIIGDVWTVPGERYKTGEVHVVPLSGAAFGELAALPRHVGCPFVFTRDGRVPIAGISKWTAALHQASGTSGWRLHDLRRTGRSLMSRAGVTADIAERVIGHALAGVRKVYDRHDFAAEKRDALERLAALVGRIVEPPAGNVVEMQRAAR